MPHSLPWKIGRNDSVVRVHWDNADRVYTDISLFKFLFIGVCVCERERLINLLFHLLMHSLVDSCMCPERELNPPPWHVGTCSSHPSLFLEPDSTLNVCFSAPSLCSPAGGWVGKGVGLRGGTMPGVWWCPAVCLLALASSL